MSIEGESNDDFNKAGIKPDLNIVNFNFPSSSTAVELVEVEAVVVDDEGGVREAKEDLNFFHSSALKSEGLKNSNKLFEFEFNKFKCLLNKCCFENGIGLVLANESNIIGVTDCFILFNDIVVELNRCRRLCR